ncbi:hypothetical protein BH721_01170 [Clostridium baratii]|uniref:hypothetical protein n=1 Tax=Clostridium baratii TaxID=1561 RepID=UPI0009A3FF59|nr:hypothetical protein [Clostridium baratii]OPF51579.1 hypothetical protein A1M12_03305 [Clostridium baratii]OPF55350.1 hypothetical protein BH721_01170 [Clostridium baratii]OPF57633.1 hypothetical protein BH724_08425 [Clostridium baratii]OPF60269.1 hypothetical protein BH725_06755 [Clostridium baratii]
MKRKNYKYKKKGSMLIECLVATFILTTICMLFVSINKGDVNSFKEREEARNNSILLNNVISELKFNVKLESLEEKFINNKLSIKIGEDFNNRLQNENILDISDENEKKLILVEKMQDLENGMKLNLILKEDDIEILKYEVTKELWMEKRKEEKDIH